MFNFKWPEKGVQFDDELLNSLYRYALSLSNDQQQAYDLVQSCCEKVLLKKVAKKELKPYMLKSIRNQFIDQYRRWKLELVIDSDLEHQERIDEQQTAQGLEQLMIDRQHLAIILQDISYQDRELLYLWAVEGNSMQELAQRTNTSRNTLLSRLNRLKKRLNQKYGYLNEQVGHNG
ncbi:MAG: sigma-70 family RNA polymerase sigma factor [Oceanospirillaceae bacterium]|nr:sigma-70 family RNA polymerase sigma factor [Oceanospirillaceae bacterium]